MTSVDLPLPDTPVTTIKLPRGNSTVTFFRLCSRAPWTISFSPLPWRRPRGLRCERAGEILAGERRGILRDFGWGSGGNQAAAQASRAGSEIDDVIGALDGFGIVFHYQHRIAEIAQAGESVEQAFIIARVEADGRFVQHV